MMPAIRYRYELLSVLVLVVLFTLVVACGDDDDGGGDVTLHLGTILPETGGLSNLGRPMIESVRLAEEDIKAAGGNIKVTYADSATSPETAPEAVNRLLGQGVHAIVGAGASGVSQSFIQVLFDEKIPQCSPSNTSPSFSTQENAAYYFRTVPPDIAIAPILADLVVGDGHTRISLIARADDWGQSLLNQLETELEQLGAEYDSTLYDPAAISFDAEVAAVESYDPDAVINITFNEGLALIRHLLEAGYGPERQYLTNGYIDPALAEQIDPNNPNVIDGLRLLEPGADLDFNRRLEAETGGEVAYGASAYDCTIILALAARIAGSTDGDDLLEAVGRVTDGGADCTTYAACAELIDDGEDIDYVGVSGPINLDEVGDPTVATYIVTTYTNGEFDRLRVAEVDLTSGR
ncbi:MAG: ABC transporter substrate-binding protein [Chloroflexi bacterium]|nr:ABC transporter substrate-binding protein [Chloroflexota bacterium]